MIANAQWITLADWRLVAMPVQAPFVAVRRDIDIPASAGKIILHITASAGYTLWLDGELVASGPSRSWPGRWLVDCHELSARVKPGKRKLAILLHPPTGSKSYGLCLPLALCAWIQAGRRIVAATDASWLARPADWIRHHGLVSAIPTGWQEHHTGGEAWTTAKPDDSWQPPNVLGPLGETPPWRTAEAHTLPPAEERALESPVVWSGRVVYRANPADNLAVTFQSARAHRLPGPAPTGRGGLWLDTAERNTVTLDTGRTRRLRPGCRVLAVEGEVRLDCFLDIAFHDRPGVGTGFGAPFEGSADSVTVTTPRTWWRTQPRGARFITWCATGKGRVLIEPRCRAVEYPYPDNAEFECEDSFFQRLWELAGATIRASTTDVLVDTCFRENSLWTFDACATGLGAYHRFGETGMPGYCFRLVADGVQADGTVPAIVPSVGEEMACMLLDQTLSWVHTCRRWHDLTGDDDWAAAVLPAMDRVLGLTSRHLHGGFLVPPAWTWHWVDWAAIDKRPYSAVINLLALRAARSTAQLARRLGNRPSARAAEALAGTLWAACRRFRDPRSGAWQSHCPPRGRPLPRGPHDPPHDETAPVILHTNGLALGLAIESGRPDAATIACCRELLMRPLGPANAFGPGWTADLLTPCCAVLEPEIIRDYLVRTYGRCFLDTGAPTFGEGFGPSPFNTAHGWGASVITLMVEGLLGLAPAEPGWRTVRFAPRWPGEDDVRYCLETSAGRLCAQRRRGQWKLDVPRGVKVRTKGSR